MKFSEFISQTTTVYDQFLDEGDRYNTGQTDEDIMFEMSTLTLSEIGLPAGIEVWTRSDPINHGHNRYRVKILKDRVWAAIFTVSSAPAMVKNINSSLTGGEISEISKWIQLHYSPLINLIDCKIGTAECSTAIQKPEVRCE